MFLDATNKSVQVLLAGAVTTNQAVVNADWADNTATTFTAGSTDTLTNGATPVTIVAAPAASTQRVVKEISIYNADTAQMTVTVQTVSGANNRIQVSVTIQTGERLAYSQQEGWRVMTVAGAVKVTAVQSTVEPGYIDGAKITWNAVNSYSVSSGTFYIPSVGANVNFPSTITKPGLALSASTFYHVYGFLNAGVPDVEHVTTAPSAPYNGVARTKTGDTTRRYLGSFLTDSGGNIYEFEFNGEMTYAQYRAPLTNAAPFRVLSGGTSTVPANVSLTGIIPVTAVIGYFRAINTATGGAVLFHTSAAHGIGSVAGNIQPAPAGSTFTGDLIMSCPNQNIAYSASAGLGAFLDVKGYWFER